MKSKLSYLCGFFILFSAWCYYYTNTEQDKYANTAIPFLADSVKDIASWQSDVLFDYLSPEARRLLTKEQLQAFVDEFSSLGRFQRIDEPEFSRISSILSIFSSSKKISYTATVFYEHGSAIMTATLTERGGVYKFYNFNLGKAQLYP